MAKSAIAVICPECERNHNVPAKYEGKVFTCRGCGESLVVNAVRSDELEPVLEPPASRKPQRKAVGGTDRKPAKKSRPARETSSGGSKGIMQKMQGLLNSPRAASVLIFVVLGGSYGMRFFGRTIRRAVTGSSLTSRQTTLSPERQRLLDLQTQIRSKTLTEDDVLYDFNKTTRTLAVELGKVTDPTTARQATISLKDPLNQWYNSSQALRVYLDYAIKQGWKKDRESARYKYSIRDPKKVYDHIPSQDRHHLYLIDTHLTRIAADKELSRIVFGTKTLDWSKLQSHGVNPVAGFSVPKLDEPRQARRTP